jgi:hypothetical protein
MRQSDRVPFVCTIIASLVATMLGRVAPAHAAPVPPMPGPAESLPPTSPLEPTPSQPVPLPPPPVPAVPAGSDGFKLVDADVGTRLALHLQNADPNHADHPNDVEMNGRVELLLSGQANTFIKWQADFVGTFGSAVERAGNDGTGRPSTDTTGSAAVLDLIGRLELHEAVNLWVGRMLVPADRSGLSTEWFIAPWLLPGQFLPTAAPVVSRRGPYGRSDGATLWGQFGGGAVKYYLGAYNLADSSQRPLYSGRLSFSLLNPEPGYAGASTYYGNKDVVALGVGFQHQMHGSIGPESTTPGSSPDLRDFTEFNVDLLFEKNLGLGGVIDLEGAFYRIWGAYEKEKVTFFVLASYLLPIAVGPGRFQPLFRLQQATWMPSANLPDALDGTDARADAQLGYIIDGHRIRLALDYQYSKVRGQSGNAVLIGLQLRTR